MKRFEVPRWSGIVLAFCGLILMIVGIYRGEMTVVFKKAVNICLECMGIG